MAQGEAVLRDLAVHPATAQHLARKLATHFVSDTPPAALVDRLAQVYQDSDGDLPSLHRALVSAPEAWASLSGKFKSPNDFLVSSYRALGHEPDQGRLVVGALDTLGQPPHRPGSPAGWPDQADEWGGADALFKRIEFASTAARPAGGRSAPLDLADAVLGPALGDHTRTELRRASTAEQGLALLLASPEFQRR